MAEKTPITICFEKLVESINKIILMHKIFPTPESKEIVDLINSWRNKYGR